VSARLSLGRWKDGKEIRAPWDRPWLDYFALTSPKLFDAAQLNSPLMTWNSVYGSDSSRTEAFAKRVLDSGSFRPRRPPQQISPFGAKFGQAIENLWEFITSDNEKKRLRPAQSEVALKLVQALALSETLPAFDFLRRREPDWFVKLPRRINGSFTAEWNSLARHVVASQAGWVLMLSSHRVSADLLEIARSWLAACSRTGVRVLYTSDPENLVQNAPSNFELAIAYRLSRRNAIWNGYQLLGQRNEKGWAIYHDFRVQLEQIVKELNGDGYDWLITLANHAPGKHLVAGVGLLLENKATAIVMEDVRGRRGLDQFREKLIRAMPQWSALAGYRWRETFERFGNNLSMDCAVRSARASGSAA
jgi:hypothetical protein